MQFYGRVEETRDSMGERAYKWVDTERVLAMAFDTPVVGYGGKTINTLRLWSARATRDFHFGHFNDGDYMKAVEQKILSRKFEPVLYPNDATDAGRELRLQAGIFLHQRVAAGHPTPLQPASQRLRSAAGEGGDPAQRHASRHRASPS